MCVAYDQICTIYSLGKCNVKVLVQKGLINLDYLYNCSTCDSLRSMNRHPVEEVCFEHQPVQTFLKGTSPGLNGIFLPLVTKHLGPLSFKIDQSLTHGPSLGWSS